MTLESVAIQPEVSEHSGRPARADFRRLFALAVPMVSVQLGMMLMGVVDTIMVGHVSAADLAGVALGNLYVWGVMSFGMGVLMALDPVIAQAVGADDRVAISRGMQRGLVLALLLTVPLSLALVPAPAVLAFLGQPADVVPVAASYAHVLIAGVIPFLAFVVMRQSLQAMGRLRPLVVVIVLANLLNLVLDWALVYGRFGLPALGAVGVAIATVIARWATVLGLLALAWRELHKHVLPFRREALEPSPLVSMARIGVPIGLQFQLEMGVFSVVALLMGRLGTVPVAAHQIAINLASLTFMVPLGVSSAASVLVGHAVGAAEPWRARRAAAAAMIAGVGFMAVSGLVLGLAPGALARLYTSQADVAALAAALIPIAAVFQVFDGAQVVSIGILRGVGDTRTPMIVNVIGFWVVGLPVSLWLAFRMGGGPEGLWWGLVVGLIAVAVFLLARVRARLRRSLERLVIEGAAGGG